MRHTRSVLSFLLMLPLVAACASSATGGQTPDPEKGDKDEVSQAVKLDSAFTKAVKSSTSYDGLFTVYQDTVTGKTHLAIRPDQLDKEFIYFTYTENGIARVRQFRGRFRDNKVFTIRRRFERIEFVTLNDNFYFDPDNALARAETATAGLDNIEWIHAGGENLPDDGRYDFIYTFDCIHDMTRPGQVIDSIGAALTDDGTWLIKDIRSSGSFQQDQKNPLLAMFYGFSVASCLQSAMSEPGGMGLGTLGLHPERAEQLVRQAGFRSFVTHDFDDAANLYYEVRVSATG